MTTAIERTDEKLVGPTRRREYITISDARCQDCAGTSQGEESAVAWAYEHSETMGHVVGQQVVNVRLWAPVDSDRVKVRTLEHVPACGEEEDCGCGVCHSAERSLDLLEDLGSPPVEGDPGFPGHRSDPKRGQPEAGLVRH